MQCTVSLSTVFRGSLERAFEALPLWLFAEGLWPEHTKRVLEIVRALAEGDAHFLYT